MTPRNTPALALLAKRRVDHTIHEYRLGGMHGSYGESVASTLGVPPERVFKTLLAEVDAKPCVGIVPVAGALNLKRLAAAAGGKKARMLDPAKAEKLTGYVTGGISPFGQKRRLPMFVDAGAEAHATILVSGGQRGIQVELAPADLLAVTGAQAVADLGG